MSHLNRFCGSNELIVGCVGKGLRISRGNARFHPAAVRDAVDLVEGQPVFDFAFIALENGFAVTQIAVDRPAVSPRVPRMGQSERRLIVGDGDQRLDAVLFALVKNCIIESKAFFVGGLFHAGREDSRPGDRKTEALEAHLAHQRDVLFVVMIKIGCFVIGVKVFVKLSKMCALGQVVDAEHGRGLFGAVGKNIGQYTGGIFGAAGQDIIDRGASAAFVPAAFVLVGSSRAAPKEIFTECHRYYLFLSDFYAQTHPQMRKTSE